MEIITDWFYENEYMLIDFGIKLVVAIFILFIGKFVSKLISRGVSKVMAHKKVDSAVIAFISNLVFGIAFTVTIIIAISHLGFNTSSLVAIVGAAGLAVGLALQGSLSNFASGVLIISFRPFKSGDFIEVSGVSGIVEEILIFSTKLRTPDNKTVIIPNGAITSDTITNYSTKPIRRIDLVIGVSYDADLLQTKQILTNIINSDERVLKDEENMVAVSELADSSVNFVVRPWVKSDDYWPTYFDLMESIKVALDDAGIEIPYPQMSIHLNNGEKNES